MPIFQVTPKELKPISETTFGADGIMERKDIQRMLREQIGVVDDRLMVIAEEFGDWLDSSRRIDLLCIDSEANLVVVELKRPPQINLGDTRQATPNRFRFRLSPDVSIALEARAKVAGEEMVGEDVELLATRRSGAGPS